MVLRVFPVLLVSLVLLLALPRPVREALQKITRKWLQISARVPFSQVRKGHKLCFYPTLGTRYPPLVQHPAGLGMAESVQLPAIGSGEPPILQSSSHCTGGPL